MGSPHQPAGPTDLDHYWARPLDELLTRLGSSPAGLDPASAEARLLVVGDNRIQPRHHGPVYAALLAQIRNPLLWLLLLAATIGAVVGETTDALMVIAIMLLAVAISVTQESRAGRALERLRERIALRSRVVRAGVEQEVASTTLVPGDVVLLAAGTMVPADALLLDARDLFVSEAPLTGEAYAVDKQPGVLPEATPLSGRANVVHMGTTVRSGTGRALVIQTGPRTAFGALAHRLALRPPETDFQHGLRRFGYLLLSMMVVLVFVVFTASALRAHPAIEALLFAIALAVGLAPEMLPAVLATMLSRGARRMADRGVLVRRLESIENLGSMDVLCTDKTGTLTEGEIRLEAALDLDARPSTRVAALAWWNASLQAGLPNPLDRAIVEALGQDPPAPARKLDEIPFDFTRKRLSVLCDAHELGPTLVTKGAFEPVLAVCSTLRTSDGAIVPLDEQARERLRARTLAWAEQGVRVVAVASRAWPGPQGPRRDDERELIFEGCLTFRDPPKPGVEQALRDLRGLGVQVKIVSGDHHAVVRHLAATIGIERLEVVTGSQLADLREESLWHLVERVDLFAEVDPGQKERLLHALQKTGHVVGFMGDGINDAPAIHAADVGISVEGATDVTREAADFVLLQRNLDTVRDGVVAGRATFANTLKYVLTTESANLGNMLSMAGAALFLPFLPLLAHQVLLNNLLSDVPSATLAGDRVDKPALAVPQRWDMVFIRHFMIVFGLLSAMFDAITFVVLVALLDASPETFRTAWFAESLLTELFVLLSLRTREHFWAGRPHPALIATTLLIAAVAVALPFTPLREPLGFVQLSGSIWLAIAVIVIAYVVCVELVKRPLFARLDRAAERARSRTKRRSPGHHVWPR